MSMPALRFACAALLACAGLALAPRAGERAWQAPEAPKDDEHWYPEFSGPEEVQPELKNGTFEEAEPARKGYPPAPLGWAHPDGLTSFWADDATPGRGKVIVLDTDVLEGEAKKRQAAMREAAEKGEDPPPAPEKSAVGEQRQYGAIGATYGVSFYSWKFACAPKQAYKVSFDFKGPGGGAKVWVRGWGPLGGETRRRWETIVNCRRGGGEWQHYEQAFHPTRRPLSKDNVKYIELDYLRVMLFAYWPRGRYSFDNLKIEPISDEEYERMKAEGGK
ncbi:MAG: hypothetical protein M5U26_19920 [Planctomycetota bacterium]|nr:hypothetical protein [Planctomycetota bacterium]